MYLELFHLSSTDANLIPLVMMNDTFKGTFEKLMNYRMTSDLPYIFKLIDYLLKSKLISLSLRNL